MSKAKTKFVCVDCGYESAKWLGRCPGCHAWNTMSEFAKKSPEKRNAFSTPWSSSDEKPRSINEVESHRDPRIQTGIGELDRVLGGGIVPGSLTLVGGDPGIGKSTLLLQTSYSLAKQGLKVLYISGEESVRQTKLRADRLGIVSPHLYVLCETDLERMQVSIDELAPDLLIVDSIQTVYLPSVDSAPGSVSQVRECTSYFMRIAKVSGIATVLVGHVTKDGAIAGPRLLEHMVDCVLYFEGDRHHTYRMLRAVKNRFGSTNEIGIFEMRENGLREVLNPSEIFLSERPTGVPGSVVVASLEGTRPVLVELQALVAATSFPSPRRTATGVDHNRLVLMMAVLEKRLGLFMQHHDAYINVAGGLKLEEPAVDLGIAVSLVSSYRDIPIGAGDVVIGEVGLTGEVRAVSRVEQRVREAEKLGFRRIIVPEKSLKGWQPPKGIQVIGVQTVQEALSVVLGEGELG